MRHQPGISRNALAAKVCSWTGWYNALGQPQVSSARYALARLDRSGVIQLPALPAAPAPGSRPSAGARPAPPMAALAQVEGKLATLGPIELLVADSAASRAVYSQLMQHHPLGDLRLCAAQMRYLFRSAQGWLGACAFQSGNFALQARDRWIGWNENVRRGNLPRLVCNTRFLILPSVRVPHLASHLLGRLARELPVHWHARYGVRPLLLETFVHPQHAGTCYKAAGWSCVGHSAGRRDGVAKAVWVRELGAGAREALRCGPERLPRERPDHPEHWAEVEFGALEIWDARLKKRAFDLADEFLGHAQARRVARRHAERAKAVAAIRFFRNPRISMRTLLAAHREAVVERMRAHPLVLVPQDESSLIFAAHPGSEGLGPVGTRLAGGPIGLMLHDSLAFTPQGVPLGVVWAECRAGDAAGPSQQRPADERSSRQGLEAYRVLRDIAPRVPDTCLVSIADREADLSGLGELFALARDPKSPRLLVRVCQGRQQQAGTEAGRPPPWAQIRALPVAGRTSLDVPRRGLQEGRKAQLAKRPRAAQGRRSNCGRSGWTKRSRPRARRPCSGSC
ncbi:MAG: DUF4338 domain-containing protein [Burkholderiaceae bacterium]|nr:DUF4338 domain-containing protein [Burkholderiaceae bacterium]